MILKRDIVIIICSITNPNMCPFRNIVTILKTANTRGHQHIIELKMKLKKFYQI